MSAGKTKKRKRQLRRRMLSRKERQRSAMFLPCWEVGAMGNFSQTTWDMRMRMRERERERERACVFEIVKFQYS